jgi:hypothetical protein
MDRVSGRRNFYLGITDMEYGFTSGVDRYSTLFKPSICPVRRSTGSIFLFHNQVCHRTQELITAGAAIKTRKDHGLQQLVQTLTF